MQLYERDFLLTRIMSGYDIYNLNNKKIKYLHTLNSDIMYESSRMYYETYILSKEQDLMDESELYEFLCNHYGWSDDEEKRLTVTIPDYIDNCKIEMYHHYDEPDYLKKAMKYINRANEELEKLFNQRHAFDHISCHGTALYSKYQFIVENSIPNIDELTQSEITEVMSLNNKNKPSEESIREISRTDPWRGVWYIGKKSKMFDSSAFYLSDYQKRLMQWTVMYDNVFESPECPCDSIVDNDYLLDGWFIIRRKENEKEKKKAQIEKRIGKNVNGNEIFIVAKNNEDAKDIFDMNDETSKNIINQRIETVKKYGEVTYDKLEDVKQELQMRYNKNMRDAHGKR